MSVYEQVKQALQDIVAPELKALQIEIKRLDEKVDIAINIRERLVAIETELGLKGIWKAGQGKMMIVSQTVETETPLNINVLLHNLYF